MSEPTEPDVTIVNVDTEQVDGTIGLAEIARRLRENTPRLAGGGRRAAAASPELTRQLDSVSRLAEQLALELEALERHHPPPV